MAAVDDLETVDAPFWRALERGVVHLPRCTSCRAWVWPAGPRCRACRGPVFDWVEVQPEGTVFSWTRTWYPFVPARAEALPYVTLVVELPEAGGVRLLGLLDGDDEHLAIGRAVAGVVTPASPDTLDLPSLRWRLVR